MNDFSLTADVRDFVFLMMCVVCGLLRGWLVVLSGTGTAAVAPCVPLRGNSIANKDERPLTMNQKLIVSEDK